MPALLTALTLASSITMTFTFDGCRTPTENNTSATEVFAKALRDPRFATFRFIVRGHAASTGDRAEELAVSERLANDVMERLIANGVRGEQLAIRGYGADHPLAGELPEDYANCRVEVVRD